MTILDSTIAQIRPIDAQWISAAQTRQLELTKPPGSLGRLEEIANRCVAIRETLALTAAHPFIVLFAADHGVCQEGVSPYPQAVTTQMVLNFLNGGAAINALAHTGGIELRIVDVGVAGDLDAAQGLIHRRVAAGTRNFCQAQAMEQGQVLAALGTGIEMANQAVASGCDLLGFGEMGIGNTTSASAITAALTGQPVTAVIGPGTGADAECMARKKSAIERALILHTKELAAPLGILRCLGGFEIAAMTGFCLGAAANRVPVMVDGFIATAAAAIASRVCPASVDYMFAAHRSAEPGHAALLGLMQLEPLLMLDMRLGEGTGAALAIGIVRAAVAAFTRMATFSSAGVLNR